MHNTITNIIKVRGVLKIMLVGAQRNVWVIFKKVKKR